MSFDLEAFKAKMAKVQAALPAVAGMIQTAQILAPKAAGLTKAGMVVNTVIAAEPALAECADILRAAVTGIVDAYRSDGTLPAKVTTATPVAPGNAQ